MAGLSPITYRSAEEFLDDRSCVAYSCLLVDIHLGGMSGLELTRRLFACRISMPVICITASDDPEEGLQARQMGAFGCLDKSAPGAEVLAVIQRAIQLTAHRQAAT